MAADPRISIVKMAGMSLEKRFMECLLKENMSRMLTYFPI